MTPTAANLRDLAAYCERVESRLSDAKPVTLDDLRYPLAAVLMAQATILRELAGMHTDSGE